MTTALRSCVAGIVSWHLDCFGYVLLRTSREAVKEEKRSVWLREQLMFGRCSRRNRSSQDHGDSLNRITNLIHTRQNIQRCRQRRSWESSPDQRCRASCLKGIQIKGTEDD